MATSHWPLATGHYWVRTMIRRRRPSREIAFSFDSFLDVVANVVGIIIRLILVVWAGSRTYGSLTAVTSPPSAHGPAGKAAGG